MKKLLKILNNRITFIALAFILQIILVYESYVFLKNNFFWFYIVNMILGIMVLIVIINKDTNPAYKIAWIIPVLIFPLFGSVVYLFFAKNKFVSNIRMSMSTTTSSFHFLMSTRENTLEELSDSEAYRQSRYLERYASCPVYKDTKAVYYPSGEEFFEDFLIDLKNAKDFIFLEFFIIQGGYMWNKILKILEDKVKENVDVRIIYDDFGCIAKLPRHYDRELKAKGIKCEIFNPIKFAAMPKHNNRDHRKIAIIDGKIGYTGGLNLADEYINKVQKFGYWKDSAIKLHGKAVWNLSIMFISMWNSICDDYINFEQHLYDFDSRKEDFPELFTEKNGYIQPFSDNPLDIETVGENTYLNIISKAKNYVYITTPYLIITNEMCTALCNAAKSGVDVRIITPKIPDKKMVFYVTRSYYELLLSSGVKIFEFTPGFIHAKNFVSDDKYAIVGTINLDFRSLYLHFENAVWLYNSPVVGDIKEDFLNTQKVSENKTLKEMKKTPLAKRLLWSVLRVFAPMM